ncbi:TBC1 domain family member 1, partial [Oncorhynchus kisutch]|uniref:TBC1 domain family member 1 n=1 Tax=Oncorhynchus kisutch TaxID=8019 RepID=UPI0012DDE7E4
MKARLQRFNLFNVKTETKAVPEIISTLRQAGKSSARNDDLAVPKPAASSSEDCTPSASSAFGAATMFAKRFEVLFCGRVTVAHKKAPPALIDECIEKFSQSVGAGGDPKPDSGGGLVDGLRRGLALPTLTRNGGTGDGEVRGGGYGASSGGRPVVFKPDPSFPCLRALDENGLSPELHTHTAGVQPTSLQENRTMLFMVGRSQIFLVSPDTKKVAIEKSFREISFCSQGIHHVDHFGFICRETVEGGSCTFVCYVFQCTDESLVDEIMLTLKQAFSVAALQQSVRTRSQQCDSCPMQQLHRLCERIEGLLPSKAKLEFQKHLATLDNQEQAAVFESTVRASPKSDQEENELLMGSLRSLYEQKQRSHQHTDNRPVPEAPAPVEVQSSSRQRLEQFKTRAKRSLTESLEGIWKGSSKARAQRENSEGNISSSDSTLNSTEQYPSLEDPLPSSNPLRSHNSTGDLKHLDTSPLSVSPSFSSLSLSSWDARSQPHGFRRRASTFSHSPSYHDHAPSYPDHTPSYTHTPQVPSGSTKPKLVRHYSVSTDTPHQSKRLQADPTLPFLSFPSPLLSPRPSSPSLGGRLAKRSPLGGLRARLRSSSSVPNFLKLLAPVHESHPCDLDKRSDVAALSSPVAVC